MASVREAAQECAAKLKVLADPTRLAVVEHLLGGPQNVGEIASALGLEQTLLSHHLAVLREAGLVLAERQGKRVLNRLAPDVLTCADNQPALLLGCCALTFNETPKKGCCT